MHMYTHDVYMQTCLCACMLNAYVCRYVYAGMYEGRATIEVHQGVQAARLRGPRARGVRARNRSSATKRMGTRTRRGGWQPFAAASRRGPHHAEAEARARVLPACASRAAPCRCRTQDPQQPREGQRRCSPPEDATTAAFTGSLEFASTDEGRATTIEASGPWCASASVSSRQ